MNDSKLVIKIDDLTDERVLNLLKIHFNLMRSLSAADSCHVLDIDELKKPEITFWSAWLNANNNPLSTMNESQEQKDDVLVGCAAIHDLGARHAEIKSMHILEKYRGCGYSSQLLTFILNYAKENNRFERLSLETGSSVNYEAARKLYEKNGFVNCDPFGDYKLDPLSVFMTKTIE